MIALAANARYREVAAYYMEHSNGPGPVMEFQSTLATLYGLDRYYAEELDERRKAYWDGVLGLGGRNHPPDRAVAQCVSSSALMGAAAGRSDPLFLRLRTNGAVTFGRPARVREPTAATTCRPDTDKTVASRTSHDRSKREALLHVLREADPTRSEG